MSRIADALHRLRAAPVAEPFDEDDQPWGDELLAALDAPDLAVSIADLGPRPLDESRVPASALHAVVAPPVSIDARSPLDTVTPAVRDQLTTLIDRVFLGVSGSQTRCVAFSSVDADVHMDSLTASAADLLAQRTTGTVCAVDAQAVAPTLHTAFGVPPSPGFSDGLASGMPLASLAQPVRPNLSVLPRGAMDSRINAATNSARVQLAQFFAVFDYVLIDIDPALSHGAGSLAPLADGVILVMAAGSTRRESARRAAEIMRDAGATVIGAVLIDRRYPIPEGIYRRL